MESRRRLARIAGLWYLAVAVSGPIGIVYAPSKILVEGNAAATTANVLAHEQLLRVGIFSSVICQICFLFLVLALRRVFEDVDERQVKLMVSLVIASVPIAIVNELFLVAVLELGRGAATLGSLPPAVREGLTLAFLDVRQQGIGVAGFFWGLWLLPFGLLVIRSGFMPKILGALLIVGCLSYLFESTLWLLAPELRRKIVDYLTLPLSAGEVSMIVWLLARGAREPTAHPTG